MATSKPPSTTSKILSLNWKSIFSFGYSSKNSGIAGIKCIRPNEAGAVTHNVPCGVWAPLPTAACAVSMLSNTSWAWGRKSFPSSVSDTFRVVRWISRTPSVSSCLPICALATAGEILSSRPAKLILAVLAIRTKSLRCSMFIWIINKI